MASRIRAKRPDRLPEQAETESEPQGVDIGGRVVTWKAAALEVRRYRLAADNVEQQVIDAGRAEGASWLELERQLGVGRGVLQRRYGA